MDEVRKAPELKLMDEYGTNDDHLMPFALLSPRRHIVVALADLPWFCRCLAAISGVIPLLDCSLTPKSFPCRQTAKSLREFYPQLAVINVLWVE